MRWTKRISRMFDSSPLAHLPRPGSVSGEATTCQKASVNDCSPPCPSRAALCRGRYFNCCAEASLVPLAGICICGLDLSLASHPRTSPPYSLTRQHAHSHAPSIPLPSSRSLPAPLPCSLLSLSSAHSLLPSMTNSPFRALLSPPSRLAYLPSSAPLPSPSLPPSLLHLTRSHLRAVSRS